MTQVYDWLDAMKEVRRRYPTARMRRRQHGTIFYVEAVCPLAKKIIRVSTGAGYKEAWITAYQRITQTDAVAV